MTDPRIAKALVHERGTAHQPPEHRVTSHPSLQAPTFELVGIGRRAGEPTHEAGDRGRIADGVGGRDRLRVAYVITLAAQH